MNVYLKLLLFLSTSFITYTDSLEESNFKQESSSLTTENNNPSSSSEVTEVEQYDHLFRKVTRLRNKDSHGGSNGLAAKHHLKPLCVSSTNNASYSKPLECDNGDTYCGEWKKRKWHPNGEAMVLK